MSRGCVAHRPVVSIEVTAHGRFCASDGTHWLLLVFGCTMGVRYETLRTLMELLHHELLSNRFIHMSFLSSFLKFFELLQVFLLFP